MRLAYESTRCPVCGGSVSAIVTDRDAVRDEVERLWAFHGRRLAADTPPEHLVDRIAFSQHPPLCVVQCAQCGHVYRNPWERHDTLLATYRESVPSDGVMQSLFATQRSVYAAQARRLVAVAGPCGRGLEVGSYVGGFLAAARDHGWSFDGVDVSARAARFAAEHGFDVVVGEIEDVDSARPYEAVAIWNTFEQLYDCRSVLRASRERLRPGGVLLLRIPNGSFYVAWRARLGGALDRLAVRLLAHNNLLGFPYRQAFTRDALERLLIDSGFTIIWVLGDTLVPVADRWTTRLGAAEERAVKSLERLLQRGWHAPWVEVYARAEGGVTSTR